MCYKITVASVAYFVKIASLPSTCYKLTFQRILVFTYLCFSTSKRYYDGMFCTGAIKVDRHAEEFKEREKVTLCNYCWNRCLHCHSDFSSLFSQFHAGSHSQCLSLQVLKTVRIESQPASILLVNLKVPTKLFSFFGTGQFL